MNILEINDVVKRFGDYPAVNHVSFNVGQGKVFGLIGPNGAGKTTMIRMITNILSPDEGSIYLFGEKSGSIIQDRIGYLPEERGLYRKVKVLDQLIYFGRLKGLSKNIAAERAMNWLTKLDAADWAGKKIQELSKGMQQKVQFISTILHEPELMILDEPFSGFDPINADILKNIILDFKKQGKTIILSTHIMEQAEQMCDDICLINTGKIVLSGNLREIKKGFGRDTILIEFEGDSSFIDNFHNVKFINRTENRVEFRLNDNIDSFRNLFVESIKNAGVYKFEIMEPSLHEIFIDVVSGREVEV